VKAVIDTNVLVSGLLNPFSHSGEIVKMLTSGEVIPCYDARIISEYSEVLKRRKFEFDNECVETLIDFIKGNEIFASGLPLKESLPDKDDEPFLEIAIAEKAEYLIPGNISHFPEKCCKDIRIVSPRKFIELYKKR